MADTDQSLNNLRYNQVSGALEAFGGGSPQWTQLTLTNVDPTQVPVTRLINTTSPITGGGNLSADRTIAIPASTNAVNGYLTAADHTTFSAKQAPLSSVLSGASVGGAANEELTVAGLLTTSTIYAVTQSVPGANSVAMIGYTNDTNGSLKIIWTADPGAGAKVVVTFI